MNEPETNGMGRPASPPTESKAELTKSFRFLVTPEMHKLLTKMKPSGGAYLRKLVAEDRERMETDESLRNRQTRNVANR